MALVAAASTSPWLKRKVSIGASSTKVIDFLPITTFKWVHYMLRIENSTGSKAKSLNLEAQKVDSLIKDIIFAKFGNTVDIEINAKESSGQFQLEIVNNEAEALEVRLARLTLD